MSQHHTEDTGQLMSFMNTADFNAQTLHNKSAFNHIPVDISIKRVDMGTVLMAEMSKRGLTLEEIAEDDRLFVDLAQSIFPN